MRHWEEYKTQIQPPHIKTNSGKKRTKMNFELALVFPKTRCSTKTYSKDELGRNVEIKLDDDDKFRIKYLIPYWEEELIYDYDTKTRIHYHQVIRYINGIQDIAQIFTLNNKLIVQVEEDTKMYGNKNIPDTERLFETIKSDLLKRSKTNFIFVKDVTTHQRSLLYDFLEKRGYKRETLFRHYSY